MTPRRLCLVRHAEAAASLHADAERPLTPRGEADAADVGRWLSGLGIVPDAAVVSPARRALQTWRRLAEALPGVPEPQVDRRLYTDAVDGYLDVVRDTPDDVAVLLVVGHNPSVAGLAAELLDGAAPGFPPAGRAVLELPGSWADAGPGTATLAAAAGSRS